MPETPFFSIVIPTYNRAAQLLNAVQSVLAQSFSNLELLIIDDGSTDNTPQVMEAITDPRVRYQRQVNSERSAARNRGMELSRGLYLCFLDSDDTLHPDYLQHLYHTAGREAFPVCVLGPGLHFIQDGKLLKQKAPFRRDVRTAEILAGKEVISVIQCIHRDIYTSFRFDERFSIWEDTHLFLRILIKYPYIPVPEAIAFVNIHSGSAVAGFFQRIRVSDCYRYTAAILDLLHYPPFGGPELKPLLQAYAYAKIQMIIYQALCNRQYAEAAELLNYSAQFGKDRTYTLKTRVKILLGSYFRIHINA